MQKRAHKSYEWTPPTEEELQERLSQIKHTAPIASVWVEEGCLFCSNCEFWCPDVFEVIEGNCTIKNFAPEALVDNYQNVLAAVEDCPLNVLRAKLTNGDIVGDV